MKNVIIFDLDGTLLDTLEDLSASVNFALASENLPPRSIEEVRAFVGNGIRLLVERAVPEGTAERVTDRVFESFKAHYCANCMAETKEYGGMTELLVSLKAKGCRLGVVTNKADFAARAIIEHYFPNVFDTVTGERQGVRKKPAPDTVLETVKALGGTLEDTVYVGDSEVDILTAENAGCELVAVSWGFREECVLRKLGAKRIAGNMRELAELLDE